MIWMGALLASAVAFQLPGPTPVAAAAATPVVVELFTSEGCSSCPPADQILARLEARQDIQGAQVIVLSEHVDYWNHLGWRDPFSSSLFTARQRDYGELFQTKGIYTPQMVVNGRVEFVGNQEGVARREIRRAAERPTAAIRISPIDITPGPKGKLVANLQLAVGELPQSSKGDELQVLVAVTETGLRTSVRSGENAGQSLAHTGVVRVLAAVAKVESPGYAGKARVVLDPTWDRRSLRAVAFVQEKKSKIIWGAAQTALEP